MMTATLENLVSARRSYYGFRLAAKAGVMRSMIEIASVSERAGSRQRC
jgi:hypothetical protein